ncbi:MAG: AMP-binding protein, partial [Gemmatimonadetes bacterium]|nr:AMP-binding protein [Gemmatimonadota bacterium]
MCTPQGERYTWREWHDASRRFAAALVAAGIGRGERVAVLAANLPLWPIADVGALLAG